MKENKQVRLILKQATILMAVVLTQLIVLSGCQEKDNSDTTVSSFTQNYTTRGEEAPKEKKAPEKYVAKYEYTEGYEDVKSIFSENYSDLVEEFQKYFVHFQGSVLIAVGDEIIFANGYGYENEGADIYNDMNTTYELGLVSAQFTAAAVFDMVDRGLIELDTSINEYFPQIMVGEKITVENLLYNCSGLPNYLNNQDAFSNGDELRTVIKNAVEYGEEPEDKFLLDYLEDVELLFEPGESFQRSNTNDYLLALIIERESGMKYEDYVTEYVLKKCGMRMTNLAYQGTSAVASSEQDNYTSYPSNLIRGVMSVNSNVIEMFKWDRYLITEVMPNKEDYQMINLTGFGNSKGNTECFSCYNLFDDEKELVIIIMSNNIDEKDFLERAVEYLSKKMYKVFNVE